tara:strand:+ start:23 stop:253 length:231 start_codon:yes stop_codon:yes gene_type:complete
MLRAFCFLGRRKTTPLIQNSGLLADSTNHIKARSECYGLFAFWGGENPLRAYKTAAYWLTHQITQEPRYLPRLFAF